MSIDLMEHPRPLDMHAERQAVVWVVAAASFLIFFQSYLFAPLIPSLAKAFGTTQRMVGFLIPAYMLAYGISTLGYGPLSDRLGRRRILLTLLLAMVLTTAGTATAGSVRALILWRILAGVAAGGIIPIALALLGDLFSYQQRGRPIGWIFGAIAGGMAFGSTAGALLNPVIGWRGMLWGIAAASAVVAAFACRHQSLLNGTRAAHPPGLRVIAAGYWGLLKNRRGSQVYFYIFLNGMFHSGIFTWLGVYLARRYGLGDQGIGLALLGYGLPGMLLGPAIGRYADRIGRRAIIPAGLMLGALAALLLAPRFPLWMTAISVTLLSLGYDMSHPLLAGIVSSLDPLRRGQAMALNAFVLFMGFGIGPLLFEALMNRGFAWPLTLFATTLLTAGILSLKIFHGEHHSAHSPAL